GMVLYDLINGKKDTIAKGGNDFRNLVLSEDGTKAAFVAERDTSKALQKFYQLYVYQQDDDSAQLLLDKKSEGMKLGMTISEHANLTFSKSGNRLLFGVAPVPWLKDTSLVDIDLVKLDIWHYKDDYLQTQQLFNLQNELKRSYLSVYDFGAHKMEQLASQEFPTIITTGEGDGHLFIATTDTGRRVQAQWAGRTAKDVYAVNVNTGEKVLVKKDVNGIVYPSSTGKYILWYDSKAKNYFAWDGKVTKNITQKIKVPLYDEENDVPDDPAPYGVMGWHQNDSFVYVYDRYNIWKVDPTARATLRTLFVGPRGLVSYRYVKVDTVERFITSHQPLFFRITNPKNKRSGIILRKLHDRGDINKFITPFDAHAYNTLIKAKDTTAFLYSKEDYTTSPNLYFTAFDNKSFIKVNDGDKDGLEAVQLTQLNPQQAS
ncbi:MAG: S9 family peptidase, partial [Flavisolibacter sp.]|nr:S9 family peptidase [Flavisolibacter sp.]